MTDADDAVWSSVGPINPRGFIIYDDRDLRFGEWVRVVILRKPDPRIFRVIWDPSDIRPMLVCRACDAGVRELCDGRTERRHWLRRIACGCATGEHQWCR